MRSRCSATPYHSILNPRPTRRAWRSMTLAGTTYPRMTNPGIHEPLDGDETHC